MRVAQRQGLELLAQADSGYLLELPTGSGKSDLGMTWLKYRRSCGLGPLFYVTPTKAQVEQIAGFFPHDVAKLFGRSEYPCLYYADKGEEVNAADSPCYMLKCPHRVDPETGGCQTGQPCPYLRAKWEARNGNRIILCTTAFFILNRLLVGGWKDDEPDCVVMDEAHNLAEVARSIFEYSVSDWHLGRVADIVKELEKTQAAILRRFRTRMRHVAKRKAYGRKKLLSDEDVESLLGILEQFDEGKLEPIIRQAVDEGLIDPVEQRGELKLLENLVRTVPRLVRAMQFALPDEQRRALNYVVAFYRHELPEEEAPAKPAKRGGKAETEEAEEPKSRKRANCILTIKAYYVAPLLRKACGEKVIAMSATIGSSQIWSFETGLWLPFQSFDSNFPAQNARIFMPNDAPNLARAKTSISEVRATYRMIAEAVARFAQAGCRSMVVTISNSEREQLIGYIGRQGVEALSYGNGVAPREAVRQFMAGEGMALVGCAANFSEGLDLRDGACPVIFFLRPGYPPPDDPEWEFMLRRWGQSQAWKLLHWRAMLEMLQTRGRNIRSRTDRGVCFLVSAQFRRFHVPDWMEDSLSTQVPWDEAVEDALELLTAEGGGE